MSARETYAVIFKSRKRPDADSTGYVEMAARMEELVASQPGFLGVTSVRGSNGEGITISYWESLEAIRQWRENAEHRLAQEAGKGRWYASFSVEITKIV